MLCPLSLVLGIVPNILRELVYILARMESEALVPLVKCDFFDKMSLMKNDFCKKTKTKRGQIPLLTLTIFGGWIPVSTFLAKALFCLASVGSDKYLENSKSWQSNCVLQIGSNGVDHISSNPCTGHFANGKEGSKFT